MLLFYSEVSTSRLEYILTILEDAFGIPIHLTTNPAAFLHFEGPKCCYSRGSLPGCTFWLKPVSLLFEKEIKPQDLKYFVTDEQPALFKVEDGDYPFDVLAAAFYLISRYEEYLPHKRDSYGRFAHTNSIAFKQNFIHLPIVNTWLQQFAEEIKRRFNAFNIKPPAFRVIPTYDIDMAWSYREKGILRNTGGALKSLMAGDVNSVKERLNVLLKGKKDPFDIYDWIYSIHKDQKIDPYFFFLLAKANKRYDRNIHPSKFHFRNLIRTISTKFTVGIHPSWNSRNNVDGLREEINCLKAITGNAVENSRHHYIGITLPDTYRQLMKAGIKNDFSMGYGSINGFRASYCLPFKWYDLEEERATQLTVFPFCYMEANSYYEQHYSLQEACDELNHYYHAVRAVNGMLITIFHNHILGNRQLFAGWGEMYKKWIGTILNRD